jgi:lysozyme
MTPDDALWPQCVDVHDEIQSWVPTTPETSQDALVPPQAVELVQGFEGYRSRPYQDVAGVWTIAYGATRDLQGNPVTSMTPEVSPEDARKLLERDMLSAGTCVAQSVVVPLRVPQRAALCSLVYNIGVGAFGGSTLLVKLNAGDTAGASAQFLVWNRAGGKVSNGLVARRAAERKLFDTQGTP